MSNPADRRLQKELLNLVTEPPPGISIDTSQIGDSIKELTVDLTGPPDSLYDGEQFQLSFRFSQRYPFDSPEVVFKRPTVPVHPHIYSNGHICLSILTDDWSPALSVASVCLSISSMLSSCQEKKLPPDDALYVRTCNKNPKKTRWWYHDDSV